MKSLHLVKTSTGANWAYRVMRDLVEMGEEVHVAMPVDGILVPLYKEAGIIIHELKYSLSHALQTMKGLREIVKNVKPDIVHSHFVITTLLMRIALCRDKTLRVFEVPGPLHLEHFIYRQADVLIAQQTVDFWIPTCQYTYNVYRRCGIDESRLLLTYYGGDLAYKEYDKGKLRQELGLKDDDIVVGMVAYMYAPKRFLGENRGLKGHEDLIDAVAMIQGKYPNLHLVIVGGAWAGATDYEKKVIDYGLSRCRHIHFLGTRNNVPELYQDFNMVVHPSHTENLGGAGESLYLAVPTIATQVGGFPDIVIPEKTGYLVPPSSPHAIADAIEEVITYPQKAKYMALRGQSYVYELLNAKNTSKAVYDFYREMIKRAEKTK